MRQGFVRSGALAAAVCGLSSGLTHAETPLQESDACALVVRDLRGQIEGMKLLKAQRPSPSFDGPAKKHRAPESTHAILARDREQANALNAMLPGMGCARLDIDQELAQPLNAALLPPASKAARKSRKR